MVDSVHQKTRGKRVTMLGQSKSRTIAAAAVVCGLLGIILTAGCNKAKPVAATNSPAPPGPISVGLAPPGAPGPGAATPATGGRGVFEARCMRCHATGGPAVGPPGGGKGMMRGPDLAKVGQDPKHSRDWIMAYVRNPRAQKPDSKMPPVNNITDADLGAVVDYLLTLKGS